MVRTRIARLVMASSLALLLLPAAAWAQSSIAGVAKDASGAVLPGVQVDVRSPALIEQVRTAVTDSQGVYRIVDLRPGTYSVTFMLPGFSTFERERRGAAHVIHGDGQRRDEARLDRGDHYRLRGSAGGGRAHRVAVAAGDSERGPQRDTVAEQCGGVRRVDPGGDASGFRP